MMIIKKSFLLFLPVALIVCGQLSARQGAVLSVSGIYPGFNYFHLISYFFLFTRGPVWILVLKKYELSEAYPVLSLNYVILLVFSILVFNESLTLSKAAGAVLVTAGVVLIMNRRAAE